MERIRVLLIEDNPPDARLIREMLSEEHGVDFELEWRDSLSTGLKRLAEDAPDAVLLDLNLPDSAGINTFNRVLQEAPRVPVVMLTGLGDETLAVRSVRKGAQDYLIKGQVSGPQLARSIRYAIARSLGEERSFTASALTEHDGKEGRAAYVAHECRVYDVSHSPLWKDGVHLGQHVAGTDLTEAFAAAPHGEEKLARARAVGQLVKEKTAVERLLAAAVRPHPHQVFSHFAVAYGTTVPALAILFIATGDAFFDKSSYYLLAVGFGANMLAGLAGILSWVASYQARLNRLFIWKLSLTGALWLASGTCLLWRTLDPAVLAGPEVNIAYLALVASLLPVVLALGFVGGKIVYG